jgi:hypothetical protein
LWSEFQGDGRVDGNVTTNTKATESRQNQDAVVRIRDSKTQSEYGGDEDSKVESPLTACE